MSFNQKELKDEKKNKRRGMFYSVTLHSLLLLLAIFPFLDPPADIDKNFAIVVEFEKPVVRSGSSSQASAASSNSNEASNQGNDEPKPQRNVEQIQKIENQSVKPSTTPAQELITTPDITAPKFSEPVKSPERINRPTTSTTPISKSSTENSIDDFLPVLDQIIEEEQNSNTNGTGSGARGDSDIDPSLAGQGGTGGDGSGKADNGGTASGSGQGDSGLQPGGGGDGFGDGVGAAGFDGEGPLRRRVKVRPNCTGLAYKDAIIVLDLCINRDGDVTYSKYNLRESSVKDRAYARQITNCFRDIIFYSDNTAPSKECGTYTYKMSFSGEH